MRLGIADDVVFRDLAGESLLLNLSTGTYFGLDAVGTRLWHLLKEQGSAAAAIATLQSEYDVDERRLRQDVEALISRLLAKELLTTDAEQSPAAH
jgi:Coenzyme PQQ synthesis protein D (PqqD)